MGYLDFPCLWGNRLIVKKKGNHFAKKKYHERIGREARYAEGRDGHDPAPRIVGHDKRLHQSPNARMGLAYECAGWRLLHDHVLSPYVANCDMGRAKQILHRRWAAQLGDQLSNSSRIFKPNSYRG